MTAATLPNDFQVAATKLLDRFRHLWSVRDPNLIRHIVDPNGVSYWSGLGKVAGAEYPERWNAFVNNQGYSLEFEITGSALQEPFLFISWRARAVADGDAAEWDGVDRFRLKGELADEVYVVFDTAPIRALRQRLPALTQ